MSASNMLIDNSIIQKLIILQGDRQTLINNILKQVTIWYGMYNRQGTRNFTKYDIIIRLERIKFIWDKYEALHEKLSEFSTENIIVGDDYFCSRPSFYCKTHDAYIEAFSKLLTLKDTL